MWAENVPDSGHSMCKGPERDCAGESQNIQETRVAGVEPARGSDQGKAGGAQARGPTRVWSRAGVVWVPFQQGSSGCRVGCQG